jgi:uncharacterized protein (TIGR00369 family)
LSTPAKPAFDGAFLAQILHAIPHATAIGMRATEIGTGRAVLELDWRPDLVGDAASDVIHGGVITTMLDTAAGLSVMSRVTEVMQIATLDLRIDYLRPAVPRRAVFAEATCYRLARSVAFVRGRAYHEPGDDIAASLATFMLQSSALPNGAVARRREA